MEGWNVERLEDVERIRKVSFFTIWTLMMECRSIGHEEDLYIINLQIAFIKHYRTVSAVPIEPTKWGELE